MPTITLVLITDPSPFIIRAAAAVAHATPGGRLLFHQRCGRHVSVGHDHDDATPCALRRSAAHSEGVQLMAEHTRALEFSGSFFEGPGGGLLSADGGGVRHWVATDLCPERTREVIEAGAVNFRDDLVRARLACDPVLGITVGFLITTDPTLEQEVEQGAITISAELEFASAFGTLGGVRC